MFSGLKRIDFHIVECTSSSVNLNPPLHQLKKRFFAFSDDPNLIIGNFARKKIIAQNDSIIRSPNGNGRIGNNCDVEKKS